MASGSTGRSLIYELIAAPPFVELCPQSPSDVPGDEVADGGLKLRSGQVGEQRRALTWEMTHHNGYRVEGLGLP